jgi:hypothetical protein
VALGKTKFVGMSVSDTHRLRQLEAENVKLRRVHDNLACGRVFRTLNVMDAWSHVALAIEADTA